MHSFQHNLQLVLFSLCVLLTVPAICQDKPETDPPQTDSPAEQEDGPSLGGIGSGNGMGSLLPDPGDFNFDGVTLKLTPEAAHRLVDSTAEPFQQLNKLYREQEELEEKLKAKKLEYQLAVESRLTPDELRQLAKLRLQKASEAGDPASRHSLLLSTLAVIQEHQSHAQLLEGVSRNLDEAAIKKLYEDDALSNQLGYKFYEAPLEPSPELAAQILSICLNPETYQPYGGPKLCGGFHPDLCIDAANGIESAKLLFCFGCHEVIVFDRGTSITFELDPAVLLRIQTLTEQMLLHRLPKKN